MVSRTRNAGKSFEVIINGLPLRHAYDLVYRDGFDIDNTGEQHAFGSTINYLWTIKDQSDRWLLESVNQLPFYCVRSG